MIPAVRETMAVFSRCGVLTAGLVALAACGTAGETTISRLARARDVGAAHARAEEHRRELARVEQEGVAVATAVQQAKARTVQRAAELRAVLADLHHEVEVLGRAERDLAAARVRAAEIESELQPLRALERVLQDQERLRVEVSARTAALAAEVERLTVEASAQEAALRPRLAELQRHLAVAQAAEGALATAARALADALAVLAPTPVPPGEPKK